MKTKLLFILTVALLFTAGAQQPINVISYNIRLNIPSDSLNSWPNRKENVLALLRFYDADLIGVQEALPEQFDYLKENLKGFEAFGVGREDGDRKGEFSAIYFNAKRFIKKDGGTFWLSATPNKVSKGWDAALPRICTWVKLYEKQTGKEFLFFNTHFDHIGVQARIESAKLIKQKIQKTAPKLPVVFTGDLNVTPENQVIATVKSFLNDAKDVAVEAPYGPLGTFNAFDWNSSLKDKIDYIFVTKGFKVQKFAVLSDSKNQRYYSDHLPVFARLLL